MRNRFELLISFICFSAISLCAQQDSIKFSNCIGWDNGIAFRHAFHNGFMIGLSASGNYRRLEGNYSSYSIDSNVNEDSCKTYDIGASVTAIGAKPLYKSNYFSLSIYGNATIIASERVLRYHGSSLFKDVSRSAKCGFGFEPAAIILKKIYFGTRIGYYYEYRINSNSLASKIKANSYWGATDNDLFIGIRFFGYYFFN